MLIECEVKTVTETVALREKPETESVSLIITAGGTGEIVFKNCGVPAGVFKAGERVALSVVPDKSGVGRE